MLYAIVAVVVIILDQWVKYWVSGAFSVNDAGQTFIPGILSIVNVHNDGAAFGLFSGSGARIYFILLTGVFTVAVILALATNFVSGRLGRWSLVMMTAGGLSNCIDRVIQGYVQDMFKVEFFNFPVFNVADIFITVFCLLFVVAIIFGSRDSGYDDEFEEEDDEDEDRPRWGKKDMEPKEPKEPKEKKSRKARQAKYEDEYEQYKAARAARQQPAPQAQPAQQVQRRAPAAPASYDGTDPFAEWEKANAKAGSQPREYAAPQQQVRPVQQPVRQAPAAPQYVQQYTPQPQRPAAPSAPAPKKRSDGEFDLDDILAEFK